MLHEEVELRFGLDRRRHMMMIGEGHSLIGAPFAKGRHFAAIDLDVILGEPRLAGKRGLADALDRARGFAIDDARRTGGDEEIHLGADAILFALDVAVKQEAREPATAHRDAVALESWTKLLHLHREAAAGLHAGEACCACLPQAFVEADVVGQFREIVVPPGDRGYSKLCFHQRYTLMRCLARISSCCLRAARTSSRDETSGTPTSQSASPGTQA